MAYDTTLDTTDQHSAPAEAATELPACMTRDNLTSPYVPRTSNGLLAAIIVLCVVYVAIGIHRLNHTDLWGHLSFGRWIVQHGQLPAADPFAAEPLAEQVVNVPWLSQLVGYLVHGLAGAEGLVLGHALLITASCGLLMAAIVRRGVPSGVAVVGGAVAMLLALPILGTIRPQLFGMVALPLVLIGLAEMQQPQVTRATRYLPLGLAILFAIWVNLHGSFAVGLLLLGIYALAVSCGELFRQRSLGRMAAAPEVRRAWLALGAGLAGSIVNPLGPQVLWEVARFGVHAPLEEISEWRTLSLGSLSGALFVASLVVTMLVMRFGPRKMPVSDLLVLTALGLLTVSAMRMLAWWALVWPWIMAPYLWALCRQWAGGEEPAAEERAEGLAEPEAAEASETQEIGAEEIGAAAPVAGLSPRDASMRTLIAMACVFMAVLLAPPSHNLLVGKPRGPARVLREQTPVYVAEELERRGLEGKLFAPMDWADYLVWQTNGKVRPLVHSHVHMIRNEIWQDYRRIAGADPRWEELARAHGLDYLVLDRRRNAELVDVVQQGTRRNGLNARVIYQDKRCLLVQLLESPDGGKSAG